MFIHVNILICQNNVHHVISMLSELLVFSISLTMYIFHVSKNVKVNYKMFYNTIYYMIYLHAFKLIINSSCLLKYLLHEII